jgi:hypothetical protein
MGDRQLSSQPGLARLNGTAQQAIAIGRQCTVDVLLTDIDLAGSGTGWEVAEALRDAQPHIGVIYVSANPVDQDPRVSGSLCFCKPYSEEASFRHATIWRVARQGMNVNARPRPRKDGCNDRPSRIGAKSEAGSKRRQGMVGG